jgi:hypothetical protein
LESLAHFQYPESSVEYQTPTIKVSGLRGTPPNLLKIYYTINFRKKKKLLAIDSAAMYSAFPSYNTCGSGPLLRMVQ